MYKKILKANSSNLLSQKMNLQMHSKIGFTTMSIKVETNKMTKSNHNIAVMTVVKEKEKNIKAQITNQADKEISLNNFKNSLVTTTNKGIGIRIKVGLPKRINIFSINKLMMAAITTIVTKETNTKEILSQISNITSNQ